MTDAVLCRGDRLNISRSLCEFVLKLMDDDHPDAYTVEVVEARTLQDGTKDLVVRRLPDQVPVHG